MDSDILAEQRIRVAATPDALDACHVALDRLWRVAEQRAPTLPTRRWRHEFATAVLEIAANIVRYAYPADMKPGHMGLRLQLYPDRAEACFTDRGMPFNEPPVDHGPLAAGSAAADEPLGIPETSYGLAIARTTLDSLDYRRSSGGTNGWHVVKRWKPADAANSDP